MLRFFRLNDPYRLLGVFIALVVLSLPIFLGSIPWTQQELKDILLGEMWNDGKSMYLQIVDNTPWLASWLSSVIEYIFGRSELARRILSLLLIFFQASFFAIILIRNRAFNESNYLPALVFGIVCFFSFDLLSFSHELLGSTFLLLALNNLFKEIEFKVQRDETVLNMGIFLGMASLFVFSYSMFMIGSVLILFVFARISIRKSLLVGFGFMFPHGLLFCLYYFKNGLPQLLSDFYLANLTLQTVSLISLKSIFILGIAILVLFVISLIMLNREARFTKYQSQLLQVMLFWLIIATLEVTITPARTPHSLLTFIPPLTYFISHYFLLIRRKWIAELMLWIFFLSVVGMSHLSRTKKINSVDYSKLFVRESKYKFIEGKRVLILGDDLGIYEKNKVASYFLNWELSKVIFEQPDYFENIILINESFEKDLPDLIIDERGLMKKIFEQLPLWKSHYQKKGSIYFHLGIDQKAKPTI